MNGESLSSSPQEFESLVRLRRAVRSQSAPPELSVKIRQRLEEHSASRRRAAWWGFRAIPVTAILAALFAIGVAYQLGHLRFTAGQQESFMSSMLTKVSNTMKPGLDDHLHCSVYGRVPKSIPPLAQAIKDLPPKFAELLTIVQEKVPQPFLIYSAHECRRSGRKFVHFQLKTDSKLLSVIVTRRSVTESFVRDKIVPAMAAEGVDVYEAHALRFQMAAVETRDYVAYVVSDLTREQNRAIMQAMAPGIQSLLRRIEG